MRPVRDVSAEENLRVEPVAEGIGRLRVDPVAPEPVGTLVLLAFRVAGYDRDCDGSLMARLARVSRRGDAIEDTGWTANRVSLCPESAIVATRDDLRCLLDGSREAFLEAADAFAAWIDDCDEAIDLRDPRIRTFNALMDRWREWKGAAK